MKKFIKKFIATLLVLTIVFSAIGCMRVRDKGGLDDYDVNLNIDKNITANLSILVPVGDYEENLINSLILGFNDIYPNVTISKSTVQIGDSYESTIMMQYQAGILPDIIWTDSTTGFYYLVSKKIALNLNPFIEASEEAGVFNVENDFYSSIFNMCTYEDKLCMIPRSHDNVVTLINTEQFAAANIDWQQYKNGWTWNDFKSVCSQFRTYYDSINKSKYYPVTGSWDWEPIYGAMLESYKADVFNGNEIAIDSTATREVLSELRDLVDLGYVPSTAADGAAENSFYEGNQGMIFTSEPIARNCNTATLKGKVDVLPYPLMNKYDNAKICSGAAGYAINSDTKVRDVAWAFLNYMLSQEGQQGMAVAGANTVPIRRDLADYNTQKWGEGYRDRNLSAYLFGDEYTMTPTFFYSFDAGKATGICDAVSSMIVNALNPNVTIEKCISNCVEDIEYAIR